MITFLKLHKRSVTLVLIFAILVSAFYFTPKKAKQLPKPASAATPVVKTAARTETATAATTTETDYIVQPGDRMWFISKASCSDASRAKEISDMNGITNPDWIIAGKDVLRVLPKGCAATFLPRRVVMANRIRSATAPTADEDADVAPAATQPTSDTTSETPQVPSVIGSMPAFNASAFPEFVALQQQFTLSATNNDVSTPPTQATQDNTTSAPIANSVAAAKGRVWYEINVPFMVDTPTIQTGSFPAFLVVNQKPKNETARPKWSVKMLTGVIVTKDEDGTRHIFAELQKAPSDKFAITFVDSDAQPFVFATTKGAVVEFGPEALPSAKEMDYTVLKQVFPQQGNGFKKTMRILIPLGVSTGIGFASGGPVGAAISDGFYVASAILHHYEISLAKKAAESEQQ